MSVTSGCGLRAGGSCTHASGSSSAKTLFLPERRQKRRTFLAEGIVTVPRSVDALVVRIVDRVGATLDDAIDAGGWSRIVKVAVTVT